MFALTAQLSLQPGWEILLAATMAAWFFHLVLFQCLKGNNEGPEVCTSYMENLQNDLI